MKKENKFKILILIVDVVNRKKNKMDLKFTKNV